MCAELLRRTTVGILLLGIWSSAALAEMRTWVDSSGKHKVEAELVGFKNGKLTLRRPNGKTGQFPLTRFSKEDQTYVRQWQASNAPQPIGQTKLLAKRFFTLLADEKFDDIKPMMAKAARDNWPSVEDELKAIEMPSTTRGIYVRTFAKNGDLVEVNVNLKISGDFKRTKLQFSQAEGPWRVVGFIADAEQETVTTFGGNGEERVASRRSRNDDDEDEDEDYSDEDDEDYDDEEEEDDNLADDDPLRVPDGNAEELVAFIENAKKAPRPKSRDRRVLMEYQNKLLNAVYEAAERALELEPENKRTLTAAANAKLEALAGLARSSTDAKYGKALSTYAAELKRMGLDGLSSAATGVRLQTELARAPSRREAENKIKEIQKHYQNVSVDQLGPFDFQTIQAAASLSGRIDPQLGERVNTAFGNLLASSRRFKGLSDQMLATARRLGLVGNPIEVTGVTSASDSFDIKQLEGKVVLVDFWATWCGPCMAEMPNIRKNYERYRDQGFEVVAVSVDRDLGALKRYLEKESPPWTVLVDEHPDNSKKIGDYYGINAIPTTVLVGADGKVITFNCRGQQLGKELAKIFDAST